MQHRGKLLIIVLSWLLASVFAFAYRDVLKDSAVGTAILLILLAPLLLVIYLVVEVLSEGVVRLVAYFTFRVVTLWQVRAALPSEVLVFPWHGFSRGHEGELVASEGAILVVGLMFCVVCGVLAYLWLS